MKKYSSSAVLLTHFEDQNGVSGEDNVRLLTSPDSQARHRQRPRSLSVQCRGQHDRLPPNRALLPSSLHPFQASIVAEAYDFIPDWAEILYQQVILKGDFNYLEEFKQQGLLRPSIFERFQ